MGLKSVFRSHFTAWTLAVVLVLAAVLRLYHLEHQSLWIDEIASMLGASPEQTWTNMMLYSRHDQPPAFFVLLHYWFKLFPFNDFSGRLMSVVVGLTSIIAIFFLGKEVKDNRTGLIASFITSFSYIHILFSQEVRFYTVVFLFSTLSYLFFIRATRTTRISDFLLYIFSTTVLLYSHYFGLVAFASQGIIFCLLLIFYPVNRRMIIFSVFSAIAVIVLIIPWIPIFFADAGTKAFWIQPEPFYFLLNYFYVYFKDVLSCFVFASLLICYFIDLYRRFGSKRSVEPVDLILVGSTFFSFLIPIVYSIIQTPMLQARYLLIALPSIIIMISLGFSLVKIQWQRIMLIATFCTSLISLVVIEQYYTRVQKEDWRGLITNVMQKGATSDVVISSQAWYCNYYFNVFHSRYHAFLPTEISVAKEQPPGVWWLDGFSVNTLPDTVEINLMKNGYRHVRTDSLYRTRASYYHLP